MPADNPLAEDLDRILAQLGPLWEGLRGARIFLTGGTGFVGSWLLESLLWANDKLGLDVRVWLLTRDYQAWSRKWPHLAYSLFVTHQEGDVRDFDFHKGRWDGSGFSHVIHAAAPTGGQVSVREVFSTIIEGTQRVLQFARLSGASKVLFVSSGAVYGRQPVGVSHLPDDHAGGPDPLDPGSVYGEAKRAAEVLCALAIQEHGLHVTIARPFALLGPYLPLDAHYAAGNFIRDALAGGPVRVTGDGTPVRSYLYAADMAVWLWTILLRGQSGRAYNVGSEDRFKLATLARLIAGEGGIDPAARAVPVVIEKPVDLDWVLSEHYVPNTSRARCELGLRQNTELIDAIRRTAAWHRQKE